LLRDEPGRKQNFLRLNFTRRGGGKQVLFGGGVGGIKTLYKQHHFSKNLSGTRIRKRSGGFYGKNSPSKEQRRWKSQNSASPSEGTPQKLKRRLKEEKEAVLSRRLRS